MRGEGIRIRRMKRRANSISYLRNGGFLTSCRDILLFFLLFLPFLVFFAEE